MGKTLKKIVTTILAVGILVGTFGGVGLALAAGLPGFAATIAVLQALAVGTLLHNFAPEIDTGGAARQLAENLAIFSSPSAARGVAFGRAGIAGQILFRENIKNSGDTPDELLLILGLAGYPATSLEKFWFNEELVFDGDSTTGPGAITSGTFANDLWVWFRTGEETTAAFPDIAALSTTWNAKVRKLRGIPSIGIRIKITEKVEGRLQPLAQIKGAKLYDPRLDSTIPGGSGTHRFADPATWEFSVNPKLAELIYLRGAEVASTRIFGMGKAAAAIDLENFASEANICEEQIDVVGGGTIDRYTCNGLLIPSTNHKTNLLRLLSASAGTMDASGGVYRTFAGAWKASSMTLTESDIDGAPTEIQLQIDQSAEVNIISGSFADPADMWVVKEYPELTDSASITAFGENAKKLDLPFTTDHRTAQRISKIQMKRLNAKRALNANYWLRAASLQPGDIVTQTYARYRITAETFRIDFWSLEAGEDRQSNRRLVVPMRLVEEQQSWFDWDETTEEQSTPTIAFLPSISNLPRLITLDDTIVFEGPSPPADPKVGWLWLDTDVDIVFRWSGSAWTEYSRIGSDASFYNGFEAGVHFDAWGKDAGEGGTLVADTTTVFSGAQSGAMDSDVASPSSGGQTGSHFVEIPEALALQFGGQLVTVSILARQALATPSTQFALAYSTNDAGDSGWQNFTPTSAYQKFSFDYQVPLPVAGGSDWLGIHPDTSGAGLDLLVDDVSVVIKGNPITSHLTNEAHVVDADSDGTNYSLSSAGGTHKVFDDVIDVTASAVHSVQGSATKNGLTMSVVAGTGVYSLSGASWTTDLETFTLRAVYGGKTIDKEYSIAKARAGASGEPNVTLSGETITDSTSGNSLATVRINNDGTVDKNTTSGGLVQIDTATDWVRPEEFAPGGFEHRATATGDALDGTSDPLNVWAAFTVTPNPEWTVRSSGAEGSKEAVVTVEIRHQGGSPLDSGVYTLQSDDQS